MTHSSVPLQIQRGRTCLAPPGDAAHPLRAHFERHHWIRLPRLLDDSLLRQVQRGVEEAAFVEIRHTAVEPPSVEVRMEPNATAAMLELLCNDAALLAAVEALTGCAVSRFSGFVYRLAPGLGEHHWHNDLVDGRRVAMSLNLGPAPYEGGLLQLRDRESTTILGEVANIVAGDAILFRIDARLQHRVLPVTAGVKTAFAGWFGTGEPLLASLRAGRA